MYKIYSRKRFLIKPYISKLPKGTKDKNKKKMLKILIIISIIFLIIERIFSHIEPVFESMCEEKAKSLATIITNQQTTIVMNNYKYDDLYSVEKDSNGNITLIKSNIAPINNMLSDLAEKIQKEFDNIERTSINIPIGNLTGIYFLSGSGIDIPVQVSTSGSIETDVKSEFLDKGINQTLHRIYVVLSCRVQIITPIKNFEKEIVNQFIIAENVIIGNIPDSYYNLEGLDPKDSLEVVN